MRPLVVVHKTDLSEQWHDTAKVFFGSASVGHIQQGTWDYKNKHMVTATAQTLYRRRAELPEDFKEQFGLVIYDEGHRYPARTFEDVLRMFPCRYRLGVSATWRRNDKLECVWHWHIGQVEHRTESTRLTGNWIQIPWATSITDRMCKSYGRVNSSKMINAIASNVPFRVWLAEEAVKGVKAGRTMLYVGGRVEQLQDIRRRILMHNPEVTVGLYVGAENGRTTSRDAREHAKTCDVILATYGMMAEGTDVPRLDTLTFTTPRSDVEQVVGRIQRHSEGKKQLLVIDPVFQTAYNVRQSAKRASVYTKLGFTKHEKDG